MHWVPPDLFGILDLWKWYNLECSPQESADEDGKSDTLALYGVHKDATQNTERIDEMPGSGNNVP